ncbi:transposase domain-containing protein [Streptomyces turgidiscabies]|uniref:transposase domain-containing protein n=1 Tax=Streptomyces turgidiscabies TaxID=85558 RepID=UPI001319E7AD
MAASALDLSGLGLLTWVYPPGLVDRVVAACGRSEQRRRLLPARLVVYFVLGLALFSPAPYLEAMRHLMAGLRGLGLLGNWHVPAKSSLFRARQRLGFEPFQVLFAATAKPMADESTPGAFWRGLRLPAVGRNWLGRLGHRSQPGRLRPSRQRPRNKAQCLRPGEDGGPGGGRQPCGAGRGTRRLPQSASHSRRPPVQVLRRGPAGPGRP